MNAKEHKNFEDLILDDSFREFVEGTRASSVEYWKKWIRENPDRDIEIAKAKDILITLLNNRKPEIRADKNEALQNLLEGVKKQDRPVPKTRNIYSWLARVAAVIVLSAGLTWVWNTLFIKEFPVKNRLVYNEIIVPVGEKSQVILSDGTHVWINSGSRFKYPICFGEESREITLEGEAYFDVTKGKSTFVVNTHDAKIRVLGTAFNVKSYPEDRKTQTTVVRGLVRVESRENGVEPVLIGPDQMAVIKDLPDNKMKKTDEKDLHVINKVNTSVVTAWKDQLLIFADETFEDMAIKMERWFNMKIRIEDDKLKKDRYTGKFVNNETVYEVLEAIEVTTPIEYIVNEDEIIITRK